MAQQATLSGKIKDENGKPIELVTIAIEGTALGTSSQADGSYHLELPADSTLQVVFDNVSFFTEKKTITLFKGEHRILNISLKKRNNTLTEFVKQDDRTKHEAGVLQIDARKAALLPSTIGGIEGLLKTFVGSNNELTSQYTVRGGNYDENLVYVNDFEIYRPFLTRSGQQEGLSFINADLVSNVYFSVGGFQAKYGDKMSSVLDVNYKRPTSFGGNAMMSLLGASLHLEVATKDKKLTYLIGLRQKTNQYL
ncbi:MAG TPA: carboxypeptidase-like regulatory domain-containing protein, partial [Flavipsychrobacter sp.]|nr:carboxypeptidase-like regulatory domain-containing protein [Flavipsychrobacter sp.]